MKRVSLIPFGSPNGNSGKSAYPYQVETEVLRDGKSLVFQYELHGELGDILLPSTKRSRERLNSLWEHTCFEAFFALEDSPGYWEMNASPSGDWNFYHFDQYRGGQTEEVGVETVMGEWIVISEKKRVYKVSIDLARVLPFKKNSEFHLQLGLTAVIEDKNYAKSYWALTHLESKPDFHVRKSFCLSI